MKTGTANGFELPGGGTYEYAAPETPEDNMGPAIAMRNISDRKGHPGYKKSPVGHRRPK